MQSERKTKSELFRKTNSARSLIKVTKVSLSVNKSSNKDTDQKIIDRTSISKPNDEKFQQLIERLPQLFWICNDDRSITYLSPQWKKYTGMSEAEQPGDKWLEQIHPVDYPLLLKEWKKASENNIELNTELRIESVEGEYRWFQMRAVPILNNTGKIDSWLGTAFDIEDQKRLEQSLRYHEMLLQVTGHIAKVGGWNFDPVTGKGDWTDEVARIHDMDPSEEINKEQGINFYINDSREIISEAVKQIIENGTPYDLELEMLTAKGVHKWVRTIGKPVLENGRVVKVFGSIQDITELKQTAEALREKDERNRVMAETMLQGVTHQDAEGKITSMNPAAELILGQTLDQFLNLTSVDVEGITIHEDGTPFPGLEHPSMVALRTGHPVRDVIMGVFNPKEKAYRWLSVEAVPIFRPCESKPYQVYTMFSDITERRRTEARLQRFFNSQSLGILYWQEDGSILEANEKFLSMIGYSHQDLVSGLISWRELTPPEYLHLDELALEELKKYGTHKPFEKEYIRKDGSRIAIIVGGAFLDETKKEGVAFITDITERKQAQEQLQRFVALSPAVLYALKVNNGEFIPTWVSDNIHLLTGYNASEVINSQWWVERIHPDDLYRVVDTPIDLNKTEQQLLEFRFRRKDGSYFWVRDEKRLLRDANGNPTEIIGAWSDITERVQLEEQFRQSQKMEAIGQLSGGVAHDFNNILSIILSYISLLELQNQITPQIREPINEIKQATERAANLTRQLLMFSRRQTLKLSPLDLNETVEQISKMLQRILGEDIEVEYFYNTNPLPIYADAGMIDQILLNLVVNARDAMPQGGHLTIRLSRESFDEQSTITSPQARLGVFACLSVSDDGCGISNENIHRIFEPFFTTKEVGKGTGLGLATVFGIVQQHNGWIDVFSKPAQGTTFKIYLPILIESVEKEPTSIAENIEPQDIGNATILIVEDEPALRIILGMYLSDLGYQTLEAENGIAALEIWSEYKDEIRLVITDLVMPGGVSGLVLAQKLLSDKPELKIIYTSGYSAELADKKMLLSERDIFLAKPYDPNDLIKLIQGSLNSYGN